MRPHEQTEQLSALIDGELPDRERASLEAHISTCEDCRSILAALRATVGDLRALPEPEMAPQEEWALRAAVRRGMRPRRWQTFSLAMGSAAAALVAVLAIVLHGGVASSPSTDVNEAFAQPETANALVAPSNYDRASVREQAVTLAAQAAGAARKGPAAAEATAVPELTAAQQRCRQSIKGSADLVFFQDATFEGSPAFLFGFRGPSAVEIWVTDASTCAVRYLARAPIAK